MKQLPELVIASKHNYERNIFTRTWWNIVVFHTFFVTVMVIVFGYILYYTKLNIFTTIDKALQTIALGGIVDPDIISKTSIELDQTNGFILAGMVLFSAVTGIIAAHITLVPTREEFAGRKRFITAVAHELRTPLAILRTNNEVAMYDTKENSPFKGVLEDNIEEIKRLANILNNLVIFSRIGAEESLIYENLEVTPILKVVIHKLSSFAERRRVSIVYDEKQLPQIYANKTALEQVFYNLIKNAVIYSKPEGGTLNITTAHLEDTLTITFKDDGIGMSQKHLKHIYEPFFRINPDNPHASSGTGLGLSLVFEIMKLHKGVIDVQSTEGVGTTFTVRFPLRSAKLEETTTENKKSVPSYS